MTNERDEVVGAALRQLDVPEHGPGFDEALRRRLRAERRRQPRWRVGLRLAAVAAVAGVVVAAIGLPRLDDRTPRIAGPDVATAAEVKTHMRAALAEMRTLGGELVSVGPGAGDEARWTFLLTAGGDFRLDGPSAGETITYDAAAGIARSAQRSASLGGGPLFHAERRGVAPGPPDLGPPTWLLPEDVGAYVRALLAADDARVRETTYDGRRAWRLDVAVRPNAIVPELSGDRLELTVDRRTGFPVRVVERKDGDVLRELRIDDLAVDVEPAPDAFRLAFPAGAEVLPVDEGFRRLELADVADAAGYAPLVPAHVPAGYELAEVALAAEAPPTGSEGTNPLSRSVVSLSYRRGFDQFLVTTRLAGAGAAWDDPLATGEGFRDEPEPFTPVRGALRGTEAELVLSPRGVPHVWAVTDELVVTVGGDLGRAELVRVAESLAPRG